MKDVKDLLSKFKLAAQPVKFLRLLQEMEQLFKAQPHNYPKDKKSQKLYLKVEDDIYFFQRKRFVQVEFLPQKANLIKVSQGSLAHVAHILGKSYADINVLLKTLRQVDDISVFQEIMTELSGNFSSNISLRQVLRSLSKK
ncbi:hypothetical protein ACI1UM_04190 [Lactococcus petauri]|uniref:hypothetical protein n=1 Tax=Lactococcus petauri TaxID=1940789 RepID=UPI00220E0204|nr:hypothetical protein LMK05_05055 [Lactococcus petauri]